MAASYSLESFAGDGVLKESLDRFEADGWDDVPTLKMMSATDMEALQLTDAQRDALEIRTYLHDRNLMQYADTLESAHKVLPELLNTNPSELTSLYGMRRGHVARFVDRSSACGVQLPPNLTLPARKRTLAPKDGGSEYSVTASRQSEATSPTLSAQSNVSVHKRRISQDLGGGGGSVDSRQSAQNGTRIFPKESTRRVGSDEKSSSHNPAAGATAPGGPVAVKGILARTPAQPRLCGLIPPAGVPDEVTPLSILEKVYVQKLTPEHKKGIDPWSGGALRLPPPMKASDLWGSRPTLLLCIRRPGCVMCRAEAHQLYARKAIFDAMGVQLVVVLNEYLDPEVKAFWPRYWGGTVVVDRNRDFFKSLGGGKLLKDNIFTGFIFNSEARRNWKRAKATGFENNLNGEGHIKGGLYIVGPAKTGVAYQFVERNFGDWAPLEEVLDVCTNLQKNLPKKSDFVS